MFKTTKSKVICVIVFSIICIIVTTFLVIYRNIDIKDENNDIVTEIADNIVKKDFPGINLKGKYNQNDIKIEEKVVTKEKVQINYIQISGLKDKTVQNKINQELEQTALNCYQEEVKDLNKVVNVSVNMWNFANFANTISFNLNYYAKIDDYSNDFYQGEIGLNYDLNTGEKIELNKLFTSDAPIENILRNSAYYSIINSRTEFSLNGDMVINDYGELEEEIAEIVIKYKRKELTEFSYTPNNITIYYDNKYINIDMGKYTEYIAIYDRYLTENELYESNTIGLKNLYTLTIKYPQYYYYQNYQNKNNYFIEINIMKHSDDEFCKNLLDEKIKEIEIEIEKTKNLAKQNPNNFYILNYSIYAYTSEDWQTKQEKTYYYERGNAYEMTIHDFEENIEPIIIEYNRNPFGGENPDYVYDFVDMLKIAPQETMEYYNPQTGEKIVI